MKNDDKLYGQNTTRINSENFDQHFKIFCSVSTSPMFKDNLNEFVMTAKENDPNYCVVDTDSNVG